MSLNHIKKGDLKARPILNLISQNILIKHRMKIEVQFPTALRGGSYWHSLCFIKILIDVIGLHMGLTFI